MMAEAEEARRAAGPAHDPVRRRDPPLQQGAAGRLPAARRGGRHRAHRRDDREPVVRGDRGAAVALAGLRPAGARRRRRSSTHPAARARRSGARPRRAGTRAPTTTRSPRIARYANGDARVALNALEIAAAAVSRRDAGAAASTSALVADARAEPARCCYDKSGEEHYNLISALHKSMRDCDPDAALYWLARMLEAGEDPLYIARRLVRFASEDIGLADPQALHDRDGGQGRGALHRACRRATPRWRRRPSTWRRRRRATPSTARTSRRPKPRHRTSPSRCRCTCATRRRPDEGRWGTARATATRTTRPEGVAADMECLPPALAGRRYYEPTERGLEAEIKKRLEGLRKKRE